MVQGAIWEFGSSGRIRTYNPSVNSRMLLFCKLLPAPSQHVSPGIRRKVDIPRAKRMLSDS